jgi:alanine or glycine:cation symporter, AGCS family
MLEQIINIIYGFEDFLWMFLGVPAVLLLGITLTLESGFAQFRQLPTATKAFFNFFKKSDPKAKGVPPLKAFFACIGGSVGVGNVVGVCTAVQIGGPGALFWLWMTAIAGAIVKYSEVYLGVRYRVTDAKGNYCGGPMYYLRQAIDKPWVSGLVCLLLCVYGVEIFQFSVVTKSIAANFDLNLSLVVAVMLGLVLFAGSGGVRRVGTVSSALIPLFVFCYVGMGAWVLLQNLGNLPGIFSNVFSAAFNGHAALGAFAGSAIISTISQGVRRGCYTGDIGIGYASVIHSETSVVVPEKQALLVIFEIFVDTFFICTSSVAVVLATGVWQEPLEGTMLVQTALSMYFPYMHFFMPFFLFLVGYATINAYFCVGLKCAEYLMPKIGRRVYQGYAVIILVAFSFLDTTLAQSVMAIAGGMLLVINSVGIFMLRKKISFKLPEQETLSVVEDAVVS